MIWSSVIPAFLSADVIVSCFEAVLGLNLSVRFAPLQRFFSSAWRQLAPVEVMINSILPRSSAEVS